MLKVPRLLVVLRRFASVARSSNVLLFPGQATQFVGMGRSLLDSGSFSHSAERLFDEARAVLGYNLKALCLAGPDERLDDAAHCQAAVFVCSYVRARRFEREQPDLFSSCSVSAGFSVGEITALAVAGVFSFPDACAVIRDRGLAMRHACEAGIQSCLASVTGPDDKIHAAVDVVNSTLRERGTLTAPGCDEYLYVAHDLFPGGRNVGGDVIALDELKKRLPEFGLRGFKMLRVAGAFHTPFMQPAVEQFTECLSRVDLRPPERDVTVYSNVTGLPHDFTKPDEIKENLIRHLVEPVRWEAVMASCVAANPSEFFECGPGQSLSFLLKRAAGKKVVVHHLAA